MSVRASHILVGISIGWSLLTFSCLAISFLGLFDVSSLAAQLARGRGVLTVGGIVLLIHGIAFWATKQGNGRFVRLRKILLVFSTLGIALVAYLTGFTVGPLLYPSVALLLLAMLLMLRR